MADLTDKLSGCNYFILFHVGPYAGVSPDNIIKRKTHEASLNDPYTTWWVTSLGNIKDVIFNIIQQNNELPIFFKKNINGKDPEKHVLWTNNEIPNHLLVTGAKGTTTALEIKFNNNDITDACTQSFDSGGFEIDSDPRHYQLWKRSTTQNNTQVPDVYGLGYITGIKERRYMRPINDTITYASRIREILGDLDNYVANISKLKQDIINGQV